MAYSCEWLKYHIDEQDPTTFPCEWAKENWNKSIEEITQPFPCQSLRDKWTGETYRTVLYADGTFIINEPSSDIEANTQAHGTADYTYPPLDSEHDYVFDQVGDRPWDEDIALIKKVEFGSKIKPTSMKNWFDSCEYLTLFDSTNLDTSDVESMAYMFCVCGSLTELDLSSFNTSNVTDMASMLSGCSFTTIDLSNFDTSKVESMTAMFGNCPNLTELDLSNFNTSNVIYMGYMFAHSNALTTIYANENFVTTQTIRSPQMFQNCTSIVGGAGTTYDASKVDKEYARIDNPPDALGYFTAK